ncbi:MAG: hypothetical protein WBH44_11965 [Proteocatella sp.]
MSIIVQRASEMLDEMSKEQQVRVFEIIKSIVMNTETDCLYLNIKEKPHQETRELESIYNLQSY